MISIIVACDKNGGIAKNKSIPWLTEEWSKEDLKRFKTITNDSVIIMGRNTYNEIASLRTIKDNILPNRKSYVLTHNIENSCNGAITIDGIKKVISLEPSKNIFIIGGTSLFSEGIELCDKIYMTKINEDYDCDDFFTIKPSDLLYYGFKPIKRELYNDHVEFLEYIAVRN